MSNKPLFDQAILYIDDEERSLKYFKASFESIAPVFVARDPREGFSLFERHHEEIGLVLSDNKMPNESGLDLLARIEAFDPKPLRILVTAYADMNAAVECLNSGLLYSYLSKPWEPQDLEHRLMKALRFHELEREREVLIGEKSKAVNQLLMADRAAGIGILSTGLNHHLRNSLTVFRAFYDMLPFQLQEELEGPPKDAAFWGDFYEEVGSQIERMTAMLSNLAEGTESTRPSEHESIQLEDVALKSAALVFDKEAEIEFSLERAAVLPTVRGDSEKIERMLRLLLQELAATLRKNGGKIEMLLASTDDPEGVAMTVFDSGEPIPDQDLKHLFDPFYVRMQRPEELGTNFLACYLTVFHHGGSIEAFRAEDGRNAIKIWFPCNVAAARSRKLPLSGIAERTGLRETKTYATPGEVGLPS